MSGGRESPRQELLFFVETGRLRQAIEGRVSEAAADLLVNVALRYCEPRRPTRWRRKPAPKAAR